MKLEQLIAELEQLSLRAADVDKVRGKSPKPLFDKQLFSCLAKTLTPCVKEATHNANTLLRQQNTPVSAASTQHLCDKLLHQVAALHRELANGALRHKERRFTPKAPVPIHVLRQDLAQHHEWERRLQAMVDEAEIQLEKSLQYPDVEQHKARQQHLFATKNRLKKCSEAKQKIESRRRRLRQCR